MKEKFKTEVNTVKKRIDSIVDKLSVDFQNLKSLVTDEQVKRKDNAEAVSNYQTRNDTNIVIKMLNESETEKTDPAITKNRVCAIIRDGLRIHDVKGLSAERKESRGRNPGVVVATVETTDQKEKIMKKTR